MLAQPLRFSFSRSISTILVFFLVVILNIEDRRRISLKSCPLSRKFAVLARWLSYQIVTSRAIIFTHPEHFRSCFPSQLSEGLHFIIFRRSKFSNPFSDYSIFVPLRSFTYSSGAAFKYASINSRSPLSIAS